MAKIADARVIAHWRFVLPHLMAGGIYSPYIEMKEEDPSGAVIEPKAAGCRLFDNADVIGHSPPRHMEELGPRRNPKSQLPD